MKRPVLPLRERWHGRTGFLLGEFTEDDMRQFAGGVVPGWLQRCAVSLMITQRKCGVTFEPQDPDVRA